MPGENGEPKFDTVQLEVLGCQVFVVTSDGKIREVALAGKQPRQVIGFIRHIQGGRLILNAKSMDVADLAPPTPVKGRVIEGGHD